VARHRLARRKDRMNDNLWHLLDRGAQDEMDVDEPGQPAPTGGKGSWKPVKTSREYCRMWFKLLTM
jgi:hypothetical protein